MTAPAKLSYFVRTALGGMVRSPFVHFIAVASLALALIGFGVARVTGAQLDALLTSLGGEVELTVYLVPDAPEEQVKELQAALTARTGGSTTLVSPAEALGRLQRELGEHGDALTDLGENPLPWSIEVRLPPGVKDPDTLKALAEKARGLAFVADVDYGEQAIERLSVIARALRWAGLIVLVVVSLTTIVIVSATLQLAIFSRREEIEIQKLVGGTDRFVRMPFLIEGLVQGAAASLLAFAAVFVLVGFLESDRAAAVSFLRLGGHISVSWPQLLGEQAGLGMGMGLLGSFVAVRRFLKV